MVKVGINGFGRIGRLALRAALEVPDVEVVAINDIADITQLAYLFKYDTVYGTFKGEVKVLDNMLIVNDRKIRVFNVKTPSEIPWSTLDVDVVIEATGVFRDKASVSLHMKSGAEYVVVSAPLKDPDITVLPYINEHMFNKNTHKVISMGSCTTNALAPLIKVINDQFKIMKGRACTIHAYTNDQRLVDAIHKDLRRARAAAQNIIPTTTGAAQAIFQIYPELDGKLSAVAYRVPVIDGSLVELSVLVKESVEREDVNKAFLTASMTYLKESLLYVDEPVVSSDIIGLPYLSIFDSLLTDVTDNNLVTVAAWYDNEYGFSYHLVKLIARLFK